MKLKELLTKLVPESQMVQISTMLKNGTCTNALQDTCFNVLFTAYDDYEVIEIKSARGIKQMLIITIDYNN